jgi:hypothetical protein
LSVALKKEILKSPTAMGKGGGGGDGGLAVAAD